MRSISAAVLAIALLAGAAPAQTRYKYPPGPPYRACNDTLTIFDVEQSDTLLAPCHPAQYSPAGGDTVLGIRGIVIGFDAKPSAFAFYIESSSGAPYTGVQAFTGAYNWNAAPYNLALGDNVAVYGTVQEFPAGANGTTEIEGPDVNQSTNDIIVRKISSGNPLPPFQIHTTTTMSWVPGSTQEASEGCLVRVRGPLRVGRTSTQGGRPGLPTNSFLLVRVASPSDSTLIDGNTLATFVPPAVGTLVDSVQGIVNQGTSGSPTFTSYRIQLRDANDIFLAAPPNLTDAYPIADNVLRLEFDRNVNVASAENEANYSLASGIDGSTVNLATVEGGSGRFVQLTITSVRTDGDIETVFASGIGAASCPNCLMSQQSRSFFNGVLDLKTVQAPNPDSLVGTCVDRSRFAGPGASPGLRISVRGVGVGQFGSLQYLEDADVAKRGGIAVFGPSAPLSEGHQFVVAGQAQEFGGETEIVNNVYLGDEGEVPSPEPVDTKGITVLTDATCDATQTLDTGEDKEGMLVRLHNLMVAERRAAGQSFLAAGPCCAYGDTVLISNLNGVLNAYTPPDSGAIIDVTGILHFASGTFRICPRRASDIEVGGTADVELAQDVLCNGHKIGEFRLTIGDPFKTRLVGGIEAKGGFRLTDPKARDQECWCREYEILQVLRVSDPVEFTPAQGKAEYVDPLPWPDENVYHKLNWDYAPFYWNHKNNGFKDFDKSIPQNGHENQDNSNLKPGSEQGQWTLYFEDAPHTTLSQADAAPFTLEAVTCLSCVNETLSKESLFENFPFGEFKLFDCIHWGFKITRNAPGDYSVTRIEPDKPQPVPAYVFTALQQFNDEKIGSTHWTLVENKKVCPPPPPPPQNHVPVDTLPCLGTTADVVCSFDATTQALTIGPAPIAFLDDQGPHGPTSGPYAADPVLQATLGGGIYWLYSRPGSRVVFINDSNALNLFHFDEKTPMGSKSIQEATFEGFASRSTSYINGRIPAVVFDPAGAPFTFYGDCLDGMFDTVKGSVFVPDLYAAVQNGGVQLGYFVAPVQDLAALTNNFTTSGSTLARAYLGVPGLTTVSVGESSRQVYSLGPCYPNPAVSGTSIVFSLARGEKAVLAIFDLNGRLVKELVNGETPAGAHTVPWDGADRFGHKAPAGLYFYRLNTRNYSSKARLALMR
jgi:flagellar hook capping protein FlgD